MYSGPFIGVPERKRVPPRSAGFPPVLIVIVYPRFNASSCKLWQRSLLILRLQKISLLFPSFEFRISLYRHTLGWIIIRRNFLSISIAFDVCLTSNFWRIFRVAKIKIRLNFPRIQGKGGSRIQYRYRFSRYLPPLHRYVCKFAFVLCSRYSSPFSIGSPYIRAFYSTLWLGSFYPRGNRICSQFSRLYFMTLLYRRWNKFSLQPGLHEISRDSSWKNRGNSSECAVNFFFRLGKREKRIRF